MARIYELKKQAAQFPVPTNDLVVKARLQQLGEHDEMIGEDVGARRERLVESILAYFLKHGESPETLFNQKQAEEEDDYMSGGSDKEEEFYTEGVQELKATRLEIAKFSLPRAQQRLAAAKAKRASITNHDAEDVNL